MPPGPGIHDIFYPACEVFKLMNYSTRSSLFYKITVNVSILDVVNGSNIDKFYKNFSLIPRNMC